MQLNYKRSGTGQTVILIHGLFGSLENLGMIRRGLQGQFDVISVDLPDHGESPRMNSFSFDGYAAAIINLMDDLQLPSVHLVGHSLGGKIAMHIALHHPQRVTKLIIADIAPVNYPPRHDEVFAGLNSVDLHTISDRKEADLQMSLHIKNTATRQFLLRGLYKKEQQFDWRFNLTLLHKDYPVLSQGIEHNNSFNKPTLFIKGGNSDYLLPEHKSIIGRLFPLSKARIIEDTGHWLHAEKPDVFNRICAQFLQEIDNR